MFKDNDKLYQVYHIILSILLTFALTYAISEYYILRVNILLCAIFSGIISVLIYFFDHNRKNVISYLIMFSLLPILVLFQWVRKINLIDVLYKLIDWVKLYDGTEQLYISSFAHLTILGVIFLGSLLFYILIKNKIAKIILAISLVVMLIIWGIQEADIHKLIICICIFYILTIMVELYGSIYNKKVGRADKKAGILYLAPVCMLLAVVSVAMPSKPEPLEWRGMKRLYHNMKYTIDGWITDLEFQINNQHSEFSLAYVGYTDEIGDLGIGGLIDDQKLILKLTGNRSKAPAYLIGSVSDVYTGARWEKNRIDSIAGTEDYLLDYVELIYALSRQEEEVLRNNQFLERRSLQLEYINIKTNTAFYPLKASDFQIDLKDKIANMETTNITFSKPMREGDTYQSTYYEMNLGGNAFQNLLREESGFSYEENESIDMESIRLVEKILFYGTSPASSLEKKFIHEILKERTNLIHENYTSLPEDLPERVRILANMITENCYNKYDQLKAIEEYLHTYTYTISPNKVPKERDFVDYFLFEQKEGYCTSFATAMAVLARCVDIPTRYVEGFVVNYEEKEGSNTYLVRNNQAHAWTEAYLEGIGWIPFEATPSYYGMRFIPWKEKSTQEDIMPSVVPPLYNIEQMEEMMEQVYISNIVISEEKAISKLLISCLIILCSIFIILMVIVLYYCFLKYQYKKQLDKGDNNKKMYLLFLRILYYLKRRGFTLSKQETILMLAQRVDALYQYDEVTFPGVAEVFMRYRYAEHTVTEDELSTVITFHKGIEHKYRENRSKLRLWLDEFGYLMRKEHY